MWKILKYPKRLKTKSFLLMDLAAFYCGVHIDLDNFTSLSPKEHNRSKCTGDGRAVCCGVWRV